MSTEELPTDGPLAEPEEAAAAVAEEVDAAAETAAEVAEEATDALEGAAEAVAEEVEAVEDVLADEPASEEGADAAADEEAAAAIDDKPVLEAVPPASGSAAAKKGPSTVGWAVIAIAALVVGLIIGMFALGGSGGPAGSKGAIAGKTALAENELDTVVGTYTYNGKSVPVTAREAILQNGSLEAAKNAEGAYTVPSADTVLSIARNNIIVEEAKARGLSISDEDLTAYAEQTLGTADFATVASSYSMDEETVKKLLGDSALMAKLRDSVIGEQPEMVAPEPPDAPETKEGEEPDGSVETKEYAEYIINLAGSEWDAEKGTWASQDGPYASALSGYEISNDKASYDAASAAYYVAYQAYSEASSATSQQWTDFVNGLLSNSSIQIDTLLS